MEKITFFLWISDTAKNLFGFWGSNKKMCLVSEGPTKKNFLQKKSLGSTTLQNSCFHYIGIIGNSTKPVPTHLREQLYPQICRNSIHFKILHNWALLSVTQLRSGLFHILLLITIKVSLLNIQNLLKIFSKFWMSISSLNGGNKLYYPSTSFTFSEHVRNFWLHMQYSHFIRWG